jgi:hypothetical protein
MTWLLSAERGRELGPGWRPDHSANRRAAGRIASVRLSIDRRTLGTLAEGYRIPMLVSGQWDADDPGDPVLWVRDLRFSPSLLTIAAKRLAKVWTSPGQRAER